MTAGCYPKATYKQVDKSKENLKYFLPGRTLNNSSKWPHSLLAKGQQNAVELSYITMVITCGDIVFQLMCACNFIIFKCLNTRTLTDSCILFCTLNCTHD